MNAVDHNNVVIFDDRGIPSIMCRFVRPKDTEEVPAVFKIGDKVADAIYISKYPNIVIDGRAYSMPMADPTVNITFDGAVQACRCKGLGWHLMTAVEYEYLLNQSREKGTMPHGNTDWGKDYYHNDEQGKVSNLGRTYTGTGPVTWNHDHTPYGVSDLKDLLKKATQKVVYIIRRLTPVEGERLQGYPDDWTKYGADGNIIADTARYRAIGNSICVYCAERLYIGIIRILQEEEKDNERKDESLL